MSMVASVVTYTVQDGLGDELNTQVREHLVPAARNLTGYRGFALLSQEGNKRTAILLFDRLEDARAAQRELSPVGEQYTYRLMSSPALGALAEVVVADGCFEE